MAHLRKYYSGRRTRGGTPGKATDTSSSSSGKTKKDYSRNVRAVHGSKTDEVMDSLSKEIARRKKYF